MNKIICIVGLPGSGKTYYANTFKNVLLLDDIFDLSYLPEEMIQDIIITDPFFCHEHIRNLAQNVLESKYNVTPEWYFFENDPESCIANVIKRNDGRKVFDFIKMLSQKYVIPCEYTPIPVWKEIIKQ